MKPTPREPSGAASAEQEGADPAVLAALVANHREFLGFLERRLGSRALAEDVLQDAFATSIEKLDGLREEESAVAWFYRVLRNAVVDRHRRAASGQRALEALSRELDTAEVGTAVHGAVCQCVTTLASTLKPEYADALRRVEVDDVPVKDFAAEVGITPGNAAVRVHRARRALLRQVARSCGTCAEHGCVDCTCRTA